MHHSSPTLRRHVLDRLRARVGRDVCSLIQRYTHTAYTWTHSDYVLRLLDPKMYPRQARVPCPSLEQQMTDLFDATALARALHPLSLTEAAQQIHAAEAVVEAVWSMPASTWGQKLLTSKAGHVYLLRFPHLLPHQPLLLVEARGVVSDACECEVSGSCCAWAQHPRQKKSIRK